jgi:fucose permease
MKQLMFFFIACVAGAIAAYFAGVIVDKFGGRVLGIIAMFIAFVAVMNIFVARIQLSNA